ncbi:hypothetical protein PUNSTDRAFT_119717, partial [Punctularia strigosozonata HHB-11173 SS5]|uniref:uncharacterized protein n=1 Tax=Punctularia strigosozonata (strain HHB-11173) TaxID=741275 RepID=UPI0004416DA7
MGHCRWRGLGHSRTGCRRGWLEFGTGRWTADTGWGGAEGDSGLGHNTAASWGDIDEEGEESMEDEWVEEEDEWEDSRKVRFADDNPARAAARAASKTPVTQSAPASRTMAMATGGEAIPGIARVAAPPENGDSSIHVVETSGAAMSPAQTALFGRDRAAKNRIYWGLSPHQNKRVSSLLAWVIAMEDKIAELGLHKFLTTRERGALFSNAEYTPASSYDMAFDWLTFPYLQFTRDKTLQESVLFYKPAEEVVVFVFLLSPSRNSMAVWRKKIAIPDDLRIRYSKEIQSATRSLRADYGPLHVDELPASPTATEPLPDQPKRRRFFGRSESSKKLQRADAEERRREVVEQKKVTLVDHGPVPMIVDGRE